MSDAEILRLPTSCQCLMFAALDNRSTTSQPTAVLCSSETCMPSLPHLEVARPHSCELHWSSSWPLSVQGCSVHDSQSTSHFVDHPPKHQRPRTYCTSTVTVLGSGSYQLLP
ncbi:hypothetical protein BCV70DRAFT_186663 [Testicularia cyperi]|uniref:Uncharacterized protein n=1 Tax=Testicularia cyperi TaxID=1882483 RepID=A0A317XTT0_9BASI|nr:hypothetical protein BCV70DRAFT_186663 [Testicularia cyperi]